MKKLKNHIRHWNRWRKYNIDSKFYKLLVLFGICRSPTFYGDMFNEEIIASFQKGLSEGLNEGKNNPFEIKFYE